MFVLMDMEWIINDRGHICPTQIAALRVTDQWISRDSFYERMRPRDSSFYQWDHVAYSGGKASDFMYASIWITYNTSPAGFFLLAAILIMKQIQDL